MYICHVYAAPMQYLETLKGGQVHHMQKYFDVKPGKLTTCWKPQAVLIAFVITVSPYAVYVATSKHVLYNL